MHLPSLLVASTFHIKPGQSSVEFKTYGKGRVLRADSVENKTKPFISRQPHHLISNNVFACFSLSQAERSRMWLPAHLSRISDTCWCLQTKRDPTPGAAGSSRFRREFPYRYCLDLLPSLLYAPAIYGSTADFTLSCGVRLWPRPDAGALSAH